MAATLEYTVILKDSAIGKTAYVNNNVTVKPDGEQECSFNHEDGYFNDDLNIFCPVKPPSVTELTKVNDKQVYDCDEVLTSTLTIIIDRPLKDVIIKDNIDNQFVGIPTNFTVSQGNANTDVTYSGGTITWKVSGQYIAGTKLELSYQFVPNQIKSSGYVSKSVRIEGKKINPDDYDIDKTFLRDNVEFPFNDNYRRVCPQEGNCCCQICHQFSVNPCSDDTNIPVEVPNIQCNGKLIEVSVTFKKVCKGRKLAVGVHLVEVTYKDRDGDGVVEEVEVPRGFKAKEVTVPSGSGDNHCTSFTVPGFCFVVEDDPECTNRYFRAKVFANYTDVKLPDCTCGPKQQ